MQFGGTAITLLLADWQSPRCSFCLIFSLAFIRHACADGYRRVIARPVSSDDKPYAYYPRTTMFIANIIRGRNASDKRDKP